MIPEEYIEEFKKFLSDDIEIRKNQILEEIKIQEKIKSDNYSLEGSLKVCLNSMYGAIASPFFTAFNTEVAEAITLQGQDLIKYAEIVTNRYFLEIWHKDIKLHQKLGVTCTRPLDKEVTIYIDTDSIKFDSILQTENGKMTIEEYFNSYSKIDGYDLDDRNNEIIHHPDNNVLNWDYKKELYYAKVSKIVRHKVTKEKWKLKTKSGKEIIVTNDHSLIVFRNGVKVKVKAKDVDIKNDKILTVIDNT